MYRYGLGGIVAGALAAFVTGCSTNVERLDSAASPASTSPVSAPAPAPAPAPSGANQERLEEVNRLQALYEQDPGNAQAKAQLITAKFEYASKLMVDENVPPMQKYRPALKAFNEILALDPGHKEAAAQKKIIEDIYRSMGREVPQ